MMWKILMVTKMHILMPLDNWKRHLQVLIDNEFTL